MSIPEGLEEVLSTEPEIMHGAMCFRGTRVPFEVLLDNLEDGMPIEEFLSEYPSVTREQVLGVVAWQQKLARKAAGLDKAS